MGDKQIDAILKGLSAASGQADTIRDTYVQKPLGSIGDMRLNQFLAPSVPNGAARPFAPGEYLNNPDGSWSSEVSITVMDPRLNGGKATVIPSLWVKEGKPYQAKDEDEAVQMALASQLPFQGFNSLDEAEKFSIDREDKWQPLQAPEDASSIDPLWGVAGQVAKKALKR